MLHEWLAPQSVADFACRYLGREPLAGAGVAAEAVRLLSWEKLGRYLEISPRSDVLPVSGGRLVEQPPPRTLDAAHALFKGGVGFVVRRAERLSCGLRSFASAFASDLAGSVQLQLFATPAATHGFGWHWDQEHVFVAQAAGVKDYYFRPNTLCSGSSQLDFRAIERESSPIAMARLEAGDWLYIPARWWHVAICREDSLSISIGVTLDRLAVSGTGLRHPLGTFDARDL